MESKNNDRLKKKNKFDGNLIYGAKNFIHIPKEYAMISQKNIN